MWTINANQIIAKFPDGNGGPWTTFLDRLIRVQTSLAGVPHSAIHTNQRVNLGDAGVDTQVDQPIPQDVTGRLQFPTCWQYKAEAYKSYTPSKKNKKLAAEINKHYAVELIEKGYAYRFCICDSFPAPTRAKWLACLKAEKDRISPYAPDPLVMTADDVATWVSQFPGLVREFFRQELREIQDLETWGRAAKQTTKTYVPVTAWRSFQESLAAHADLSRPCHDVGLSLQGEAGVGKTRGTYESLAVVPGAEGLVLYTSDERLALSVARHLLNDNHAHAILVADECLVGTRATLEDLLGPVSERVRLITITNTGTRPPGGSPEFWLEHITPENIREILQQNFPTLPQDRRALYADLAGGFVRLAVQLCRDHALIERHGISVGTSRRIREYLELVLGSDTDKEKTLLALSLCRRVGYREDVAAELDALCTLVSIDRARTQELANRMKDVPGFVAQAGRYLYVTPAIIAAAAFEMAWQKWVGSDPSGFLKKIPDVLLESFWQRVNESATPEIGKVVTDFFRDWLTTLDPNDLKDVDAAKRLAMLVETFPERNLPLLRALVEQSSVEDLKAITGHSNTYDGQWGPRRQLVWLTERLARFVDFFPDAERILRRLALAESEPQIGNNATHIWQQLFRIYLSGSATPFLSRLPILEQQIFSQNQAAVSLAFGALWEVFNPQPLRMEGRPVAGGRIAPADWSPDSEKELRACRDASFDLIHKAAKSRESNVSGLAKEFLIRFLPSFLSQGWLDRLRDALSPSSLPPTSNPKLVERVEEFLQLHEGRNGDHDSSNKKSAYLARVGKWLEELQPKEFAARLVNTVGRNPWGHSARGAESAWQQDVAHLGQEILDSPKLLDDHLSWLCSPDARGAFVLGQYLGRSDPMAGLLDRIMLDTVRTGTTALARGYVLGFLETGARSDARVNRLLDELQEQAPSVAYDLILACGDRGRAVSRLLYLVDKKLLPASFLRGVAFGINGRKLTGQELLDLLQRLLSTAGSTDQSATEAGLDLLASQIYDLNEEQCNRLFASPSLREAVLAVLVLSVNMPGREGSWVQVARALGRLVDIIPVAMRALVSEDHSLPEQVETYLVERASDAPCEILDGIHSLMTDPQTRFRLLLQRRDRVMGALPMAAVAAWLQRFGVEGARCLAPHLPRPFVNATGEAHVPEITAYILKHFEEDEQTFRAFIPGAVSIEVYWTEGGKKRERDAEAAEKFLHHSLRRIRQWAKAESAMARAESERQRLEDEEEKALA